MDARSTRVSSSQNGVANERSPGIVPALPVSMTNARYASLVAAVALACVACGGGNPSPESDEDLAALRGQTQPVVESNSRLAITNIDTSLCNDERATAEVRRDGT